jgi:rhamnogalacturonyl hydrolase YesR
MTFAIWTSRVKSNGKPSHGKPWAVAAAGILLMAAALPCSAQQKASSQKSSKAQPKEFQNWPSGSSPEEIGKRVAERYVSSGWANFSRPGPPKHLTYPEACTWYGALTFANLTGDKELTSKLVHRFDPLLGQEASLVPDPVNVDSSVFGIVPFQLYIETKDSKYLEIGKHMADAQWEKTTPDGLTTQTRYWIDDMYMIIALQTQAFRATGDQKYLDRAAMEMTAYLDKLQQPNGLFYHAPDVPFYWGRGNGWVAAGMTELLRSMPKNHPRRAKILQSYKKMMKSLLQYQGKDGTWRQLIDHPESWPETSSTGMFTFAMISGVKNGWLDAKTYGTAARKAWIGLVSYINADGDVSNVCEGTNKKNDLQYYLDRKRNTGDLHGQAPILWSASALLR